ncbi:unnamed protein product, partial [Prorocentrum cordatum]
VGSTAGKFADAPWQMFQRSAIAKLEMELAGTKAELAKAENKDSDSMGTDASEADDIQKNRGRIAAIDDSLSRIKDSKEAAFLALRKSLEDERAKLRTLVASARPLGARLRDRAQRSLKLEKTRETQGEVAAQIEQQMDILRPKQLDQQNIIHETEAELENIQAEQSRLAALVPQAPESAAASLPASGPGVAVEKLGASSSRNSATTAPSRTSWTGRSRVCAPSARPSRSGATGDTWALLMYLFPRMLDLPARACPLAARAQALRGLRRHLLALLDQACSGRLSLLRVIGGPRLMGAAPRRILWPGLVVHILGMLLQDEQAHGTGANPPGPGFARGPLHAKPGAQCVGYADARPGAAADCTALKGEVVTANVSDGRQLAHFLERRKGAPVAVQKHMANELHLRDL